MDQAELLRSLTALLDAGRWEDAYIWFREHQNAFTRREQRLLRALLLRRLWHSPVLLALTILNFMAAVGTLRYDRDRGPELEGTVEAVFAGQEAVRVNTYTLWVEEASLIQGTGELHITWRAASPCFWETPNGEFSQAWTGVDDQGTIYTSIWERVLDGERMLPYVSSVQFTGALVWRGEQTVYGVPQEAQWIQINIETGEGTVPVVLEREETP